jgi:hypothetical protein
MQLGPRVLSAVVGLTVGLLGVDRILSSSSGDLDPRQEFHNLRRLDAAIEHRREVSAQRLVAKCRVAERLLAGELTLFEAAAWFRFLNDNPPECRHEIAPAWRGNSEEERLCRMVIGWIKEWRAPSGSSERAAIVEQLEKQLEEHIAQHGQVVLPQL